MASSIARGWSVAHGQRARAAGVVAMHQAPPTAKEVHFVTLEDEAGLVNVVVRPEVYAKYRAVLRGTVLLVEGRVQRRDGVTNLVAEKVTPLRVAQTGAV